MKSLEAHSITHVAYNQTILYYTIAIMTVLDKNNHNNTDKRRVERFAQ